MKKPEKKNLKKNCPTWDYCVYYQGKGYNRAIDDYEAYHNEVIKRLDDEIEKWKMSNQNNINTINRMEKRWRLRQRGEIK